jgi:hypothetical protein
MKQLNIHRFPIGPTNLNLAKECQSCGREISSGDLCGQCSYERWTEKIVELETCQFLTRLCDIFDGEEKDFYPEGNLLILVFYGNEKKIAQAQRLLDAREVKYEHKDGGLMDDSLLVRIQGSDWNGGELELL